MLSARIHATRLFDIEDIESILEDTQEHLAEHMHEIGTDLVSYEDVREAVLFQMEVHLEMSANSSWPYHRKLSEPVT